MSNYNSGQVPPQQPYDGENGDARLAGYQPPKPPKKKHTGLKVFGVIVLLGVVGLVGCVAVVGKAVDDASTEAQGTNQPATSTDETACQEALETGGMKVYADRPAACKNVTGETYMKIQANIYAKGTTKPKASAEAKPYEYTGLKVTKDDGVLGSFAGKITIKNNTDKIHDYSVTVTVFKGSQDVGSLMGTIKVKANAAGQLKLTSLDDYVSGATDYQVEILQVDF